MRRAEITIEWVGPDKAVRELIDLAVERLFMDDEFMGKVSFATSAVKWTPRVKS